MKSKSVQDVTEQPKRVARGSLRRMVSRHENENMKHIDEWLDEPASTENERAAKEWLNHFRRPAIDKDSDWLNARVVTCDYRGARYRCIGASRMGDVWLTSDMARVNGYDLRIDVAECSAWLVAANADISRRTVENK